MILDSNIIIYSAIPENIKLRQFMYENNFYCSRISYLEVLGYHKINYQDKSYFKKFFNLLPVIEMDKEIIEKAVELRQLEKLSVGDSIIAATAYLHDLILVTNNEKDFKKLSGIKMINPFKL